LLSLKSLKQNYSNNDMMDINKEFNRTLYIAEKGITHKWIIEVEDYIIVPKNVSRSYPYFSKKLENFKILVKEQKGQVKELGEEISMQAEETEAKLKNNEKVAEDQIAKFYVSSKKWFEKNIL
jgi:hypothetical protein